MYSILEIYRASGRPTGRTMFSGTINECLDWLEQNNHLNAIMIKGELEDITCTDENNFLQWK